MKHLCRACMLTLLALSPWESVAIAANTATTSVTVAQGALTISPQFITVSYTAPAAGTRRIVPSSFTVHVTDARGTLAGWDIRASVVATQSPRGGFPIGQQSITGVSISSVTGIAPNLSTPSDALLPAIQLIARSAPKSGAGSSTETFATQLILANGLPGGQYSATLMIFATETGTTGALPPGRSGPVQQEQAAPNPAPISRPAPIAQSGGSPNPAPLTPPSMDDPPPTTGQPGPTPVGITIPTGAAQDSPANVASPMPAPGNATTNTASNGPQAAATGATPGVAANPPPGGGSEDSASAIALAGVPVGAANPGPAPVPGSPSRSAVPANPPPGVSPAQTAQGPAPPSAAPTYPVIALQGDVLSVAVPFIPALYDPAVNDGVWHMQTTFLGGAATNETVRFTQTTPIRTNLGQFFSATVDPIAGTALITVYPLDHVGHLVLETPTGTVVVTIGAGP